jgi:hypothetical protein
LGGLTPSQYATHLTRKSDTVTTELSTQALLKKG